MNSMLYLASRWEKAEADVQADETLNAHLDSMAANAPAAEGSRQPPEAEAAFSNAKAAAEAAVTPGLQYVWKGKEYTLQSLKITSKMKVRTVKEMVSYYFGIDSGYILGYIKREMGTKVKKKCESDIDASAVIGGELMSPNWGQTNPGVVEKFFATRNTKYWDGDKLKSDGAAAFPGTSNHAGRGAFDLTFKVTALDSNNNEIQEKEWGTAKNNVVVRATSWWKKVDEAFSANNFHNYSGEYWHFDYLGKMSDPDQTLDIGPLREELKTIAVYANMVEYDLADALATCQQEQINNFDNWISVTMLKDRVVKAKNLQLDVVDNTKPE